MGSAGLGLMRLQSDSGRSSWGLAGHLASKSFRASPCWGHWPFSQRGGLRAVAPLISEHFGSEFSIQMAAVWFVLPSSVDQNWYKSHLISREGDIDAPFDGRNVKVTL